jgi:UDP-glucose 4-epimerase
MIISSGEFITNTGVVRIMRILVTGADGFIRGHLAERFVRDGHDVTVLDNFYSFYDTRIKEHNLDVGREASAESEGMYRFIEGDIRDGDVVNNFVAEAEYVYHQGGVAGVRRSVMMPREYNDVNVDGTLNTLEAARETNIKRLVFASCSSIYGKPVYIPYEEHPTTPVSPYVTSKLAVKRYWCTYHEVYGIPTVALRYFTVYDPRMRPNMAISNFVSRCLNGEPPVIHEDGTQTRDFTYIDDVVEGNLALLDTGAVDGEAVNIGSSDNIEIRELAEEVRDRLAPDLELVYDDRHDSDAEHTYADVSNAKTLLSYDLTWTIRESVQEFIAWYRENREWYEPLVQAS